LRRALFVLIFASLLGCAPAPSPSPPQKSMSQVYQEAFDRHFAPGDKWINAVREAIKCGPLIGSGPGKFEACQEALPPPATYLPTDRKKDELLADYLARKNDEWDEKDCRYKGLMQARFVGENQRIEDQCLQTLEIKKLRKAIEKQNKQ
jgi:hypothetical protein